jgi:hypothetical protein
MIPVSPADGAASRVAAALSSQTRVNLAAVALFSTRPSGRALAGWCPSGWLETELDELREAAREGGEP